MAPAGDADGRDPARRETVSAASLRVPARDDARGTIRRDDGVAGAEVFDRRRSGRRGQSCTRDETAKRQCKGTAPGTIICGTAGRGSDGPGFGIGSAF